MAINISAKTDYSYLFSSIGKGAASVSGSSFLSDYASIKNGSYGKLMKAYYGKTGKAEELVNKNNSSTLASKDSAETLARIQKSTDALKESADALLSSKEDADTDTMYNAVDRFIKDYNSVIESTEDSNTKTIASRSQSMITATQANSKLLGKVGITVNDDFTLSIDKEAFQKADKNTVQSLFKGSGSYAYRVSAQASLINFSADSEASKANTYNYNGTFNKNYSSGSIFNSFF